jgi:hypothetical protein
MFNNKTNTTKQNTKTTHKYNMWLKNEPKTKMREFPLLGCGKLGFLLS